MKQQVLRTYAFNLTYAKKLVADLSDAQMCAQPPTAPGTPGASGSGLNHAAWVFGHLAATTDWLAGFLGLPPIQPAAWGELFGPKSKPLAEPAKYPGKAALLQALENGHRRVAEAYERADAATLDKPNPVEAFRLAFPTLGDLMAFGLTSHEALHLGQVSAWRRAQGLPSAF